MRRFNRIMMFVNIAISTLLFAVICICLTVGDHQIGTLILNLCVTLMGTQLARANEENWQLRDQLKAQR